MESGKQGQTRNSSGCETWPDGPHELDSGKALPGMKLEQFFKHHGIVGNPFSEEDAQTDTVFKRRCLATIHHPAWNKFFGSPADPSTALVFGEKGSGKTALRLQANSELEGYNQSNPGERVFVISYDDFNPYLDNCRDGDRASDMAQVLRELAALGPHGRHPLAGGDAPGRPPDQREGRPLGAEPGPAARPAAPGGPVRRLDRRADRAALEPAAPPLGFRPLWTRRDLQIGFGTTLIVIGADRHVSRPDGAGASSPG